MMGKTCLNIGRVNKKLLFICFFIFCSYQNVFGIQVVDVYVSLKGSDKNEGTILKPFLSIERAIEVYKYGKANAKYKIHISEGTYELEKKLTFNSKFFSDSSKFIEFIGNKGETINISGGRRLRTKWIKTSKADIWKLSLPKHLKNLPFAQALFKNNQRIKRGESQIFYTKGRVPRFDNVYGVYDFKSLNRLLRDSIEVFTQFIYKNSDLDYLKDIHNAKIIIYNSWEASIHSILKLDTARKIVYLKNPMSYPIGFFAPNVRFKIVNAKEYLEAPETWHFDESSNSIYYHSFEREDPNNESFTLPILDKIVETEALPENQYVYNVSFNNVSFKYSTSAWGINATQSKYWKDSEQAYPWLKMREGFSSVQAGLDCGEAILLKSASNWTFQNCTFAHLGNYALRIGEFSISNRIENCKFFDIGGGGIIIGFNYTGPRKASIPTAMSPSRNQIVNNDITDVGKIFFSSVGLGIMQANNTLIHRNTIHNLPYTGISVGWTYSYEDNYSCKNTISENVIYNVMKILSDGGGIYTLGRQMGTIFRHNYIHTICRSTGAVGAPNNGFFFDQGSSGFVVEENVVFNIAQEDIRFNETDTSKILFSNNYFQKSSSDNSLQLKLKRILKAN